MIDRTRPLYVVVNDEIGGHSVSYENQNTSLSANESVVAHMIDKEHAEIFVRYWNLSAKFRSYTTAEEYDAILDRMKNS